MNANQYQFDDFSPQAVEFRPIFSEASGTLPRQLFRVERNRKNFARRVSAPVRLRTPDYGTNKNGLLLTPPTVHTISSGPAALPAGNCTLI